VRNSAVGRVEEQALDRYLHDCEATGHAMCSDLGSSCNEDSPLCEQARQALWDSRRAEHDWSRFDVRQELVRLGTAASRTTDGQFLPCSDSFTIRSCRGRWCTTRGTPAPMGGQHADPAVLGGLCPEGGGFVVLGRESRQRHGAKSLQLGGLGVEPAEWAEPLDAVTSR
jgi:hypothetical protein